MNQEDTPKTRRASFNLAIAAICVLVTGFFYSLTVMVRGAALYDDVTRVELQPMENQGRYIGNVGRFDPVLGHVLRENGRGGWLIHGGDPVPFYHDDEGRRVAQSVRHGFQGVRHPRILFLGDSYTYGQLVAAEDAFPSRVAAELKGESINAGVPGYGLAQMTLLAEKLIPKYKPDYVVAQYSDWLTTRSMSEFATDREGQIMAPYIFESGNEIGISPVPFNPPENSILLVEKYKKSKKSLWDKICFIGEIGFPFFLKRDGGLLLFRIKQQIGMSPRPSRDPEKVTRFSYARLDELSRKNGAQLIILGLGNAQPFNVPGHLFPQGVPGVNAWRAMVEKLSTQVSDEYVAQYYLSRGNPPQPVDGHPNERAHKIIASLVAERIRRLEHLKHPGK